jgi:hypothetical protein
MTTELSGFGSNLESLAGQFDHPWWVRKIARVNNNLTERPIARRLSSRAPTE